MCVLYIDLQHSHQTHLGQRQIHICACGICGLAAIINGFTASEHSMVFITSVSSTLVKQHSHQTLVGQKQILFCACGACGRTVTIGHFTTSEDFVVYIAYISTIYLYKSGTNTLLRLRCLWSCGDHWSPGCKRTLCSLYCVCIRIPKAMATYCRSLSEIY